MNHNRKKNKMQRRVWTKDQNKTSTVTGKKGEKEKWKIRKKYCSLPKLTHVAERKVFMFTLSQLATHSSMPPVMPHMLRWAFLRSKLNMKNHGVWPSHRCPGDGEYSGGYETDSSHTDKTHLPGCQSRAASSPTCLKSQFEWWRGVVILFPPL